jgi:Domain of unknown function (DUF4465)
MTARRRLVTFLGLVLGLVTTASGGDIVVDFNDLTYPGGSFDPGENFPKGPAPGSGSYDNGWDLPGGFTSNGTFFSNSYDSTFHAWSGWAYSNVNDPTTTGPTPFLDDYKHQFAAISGSGIGGSGNYGVSSGTGATINLPAGASPVSFEVTNSTYTYLSMTHGDGFAKQFTTGDFFELKIFGYSGQNGSGAKVGEVDFFLANYTSENSLPVSVWTLVDLTPLSKAVSLGFDYASSDIGDFGINTPEFFAMDDLTLSTASVPEPPSAILAALATVTIGVTSALRRSRRNKRCQEPITEV